jgi:hypothetical protein
MEVSGPEHGRGRRAPDGGEELGRPSPAQFAGQQGADDHRPGGRQSREGAQADKRVPEDGQGQTGDERCEHRLIDVAPGEVPGALQEVQLVAVPPVPAGESHEDGKGGGRGEEHPAVERL